MAGGFFNPYKLKEEIESWSKEGIINDSQRDRLIERYHLQHPPPWYLSSGFIIRAIAIVLGCLGLLLAISENWDSLPIPMRMATGLIPLGVAWGTGIFMVFRERKDEAELAFFLGSILFGINIALQAQIFHISSYFPNGVLWWCIGSMPIAFWFRSNLQNFLLQLLFAIWLGMQMNFYQFSFIAPVLFAGILVLLFIRPNVFQLVFALVNLWLFVYHLYAHLFHHGHEGDFLLIGIALVLFSLPFSLFFLRKFKGAILDVFNQTALSGMLFLLFIFSFKEASAGFLTADFSYFPLFVFVPALLGMVLTGIFIHKPDSYAHWLVGLGSFLFLIFFVQNQGGATFKEAEPAGKVISLLCNLLFFSHAVWRIWHGIHYRIKMDFLTGIFLLLGLALARYFNLFENYLVTSLIFILSGVMLWVLNQFWNRRYAK